MPLYVRPSSRYVFAPSSLVPSSRATNTTPLSGRKSAKAAAPEEPLPETPPYPLAAGDDDGPWEEKFDEHSGLPYFVHRVTGESAWDKPGTEDAYAEAPDGAPLDDLDDLGSEESVYETTTESNPGAWGTVVDSKPDEDGEDGMASMLGAMMARDDDAETVGSEESVYEHTTESNPGMWGTVVDSKPDEEGDDGMASMLAGMMATGDEGKP